MLFVAVVFTEFPLYPLFQFFPSCCKDRLEESVEISHGEGAGAECPEDAFNSFPVAVESMALIAISVDHELSILSQLLLFLQHLLAPLPVLSFNSFPVAVYVQLSDDEAAELTFNSFPVAV
ncbi:MAG: hypothetical protein NZ954_08965 [Thermofilaceae archaeon]|nr:hypothetical protein [Thermofilaceae archaeon]